MVNGCYNLVCFKNEFNFFYIHSQRKNLVSVALVDPDIFVENSFCFLFVSSVAFRTTPMDSTGVSHILEHTVLCGSEKFPCRDPFFKMLNRSLSTFMNAFTGMCGSKYSCSFEIRVSSLNARKVIQGSFYSDSNHYIWYFHVCFCPPILISFLSYLMLQL